jgi:hypothetical protein
MRYAAYGSNLHPLRLRKRAPSARFLAATTIPGWSLEFHKRGRDGSGKCNIVAAETSVLFALFDIDANDRPKLDAAEGLNLGYEEITMDTGNFGRCFCYVASNTHIDDELKPFSWYKELVIAGLEYHQASTKYLQRVQSIEHIPDDNEARHRENMAIVAEARNGS